ncbi:terminase small subunit [Paracoccus yeei]|uniref:terminase small subunit n=1 Tax=Paracoccus yeei TaxID=147645 RepID=UPI001C8DF3B0|nr:terminase small subunit [Paracoccus yeei]MBY0138369.1 terminase small subunit [Paracoccus yeei]
MGNLTAKQARFVEEYLIDLNATQAAIRAGYSPRTAEQQGSRLLRNAQVAAAATEAQAARSAKTQITQERVLEELAKVGFSDVRKLFSAGALRSADNLHDDMAGAIASIEVVAKPGPPDEDGNREVEFVHKIKLWDKIAALEKIGRHLGMFDGGAGGDDDALPVTVTIGRRKAVGNVRVTGTE